MAETSVTSALGNMLDLIDSLYREYDCVLSERDENKAEAAREIWLASSPTAADIDKDAETDLVTALCDTHNDRAEQDDEIERLRGALQPFAEYIRRGGVEKWSDLEFPPNVKDFVNLGDIRRAAALAQGKD